MSSRIMMVLAAFLAVGSVALLWYGTRLGREAPSVAEVVAQNQPPAPEAPKEVDVVALAVDVPRGHVLSEQDFTTARVEGSGAGYYLDAGKLAGEITRKPLPAGTVIEPDALVAGGDVARSLFPGERAVAVQVNEVIGVGGFVQPDDYVDVLLYLKGRFEQVEQSQAQVVLRKVRVLALGDVVTEDPQDPPPPEPAADPEPQGVVAQATEAVSGAADAATGAASPTARADERNRKVGKRSQSAVLAINEADVSRLMLAASAGELRLALLPTQEGAVATAPEPVVDPVGLTPAALAAETERERAAREAAVRRVELDDLIGKNKPAAGGRRGGGAVRRASGGAQPAGPSIMILRGDEQAERVAVSR